jgi:hypothetical protein
MATLVSGGLSCWGDAVRWDGPWGRANPRVSLTIFSLSALFSFMPSFFWPMAIAVERRLVHHVIATETARGPGDCQDKRLGHTFVAIIILLASWFSAGVHGDC